MKRDTSFFEIKVPLLGTLETLKAQQQKGVGNYCISILLIAFTLNRLSYILFVVLISVLFKKVPKTGQSCTAFGASFVQELPCNIFNGILREF